MKRSPKALSREEILRLFASEPSCWPEVEKTLLEQGAFAARIAFELNDNGFAASFLPKAAKKAVVRAALEDELSASREPLTARLRDPSPKRRKQAARLIGALANPLDAPALIGALKTEDTRFVRPSLLLALGNLDCDAAREALRTHTVDPPASPEDEKHFQEEQLALSQALARTAPALVPVFLETGEEVRVALRGAIPSTILSEGADLGVQMLQRETGVELFCTDFGLLSGMRSWHEALLPLGKCTLEPQALAALAERFTLYEKLCRWHGAEGSFPLRLEVRGVDHGTRAAFIRACVPALSALGFANAPGAYAAELRVEAGGGQAAVYAKLTAAPDTRFDYRKKVLPASIHPADAAALIRFAFDPHTRGSRAATTSEPIRPLAAANSNDRPFRVLDPCCGSGTLLIEYGKFAKTRLFGVDIAHSAIEAARENARAAGLDIQFVRKDLRDFLTGEPFDAVAANLPFGLRTGTHGENKTLYPALLDCLPRWLKKGGIAALYTADAGLLHREIRKRRFLRLRSETVIEAGGLCAHLFVLVVQ